MSVQLSNLTNRPVWLTLTSGQALRLSPGETSAAVHEGEVQDNPQMQRLIDQHIVGMAEASDGSGGHQPPKPPKPPKPGKRATTGA